jgi:hypothetical protein
MLSPRCAALVAELQAMSPMPDDETLHQLPTENHLLDKLDTILTLLRQETLTEYPFELISSLLEVFGVGDGNGVYCISSKSIRSWKTSIPSFSKQPGVRMQELECGVVGC